MANIHPHNPDIYLASQSPRRHELLRQIGVNFKLLRLRCDPRRVADVDETPHDGEAPDAYVLRVCRAKAKAGAAVMKQRKLPPAPVLAADTTVALGGMIFGKPCSAEEAARMLRQLSGCEHRVHSAVAIAQDMHVEMAVSTSAVRFVQLDEERIQRYLLTNEYVDKAGGYAIQGHAGAFIEHLSGSYSGVMGLPLFETVQLLRHFGCLVP